MVSEAVVSKSAGHLTVAGLALLAGFAVGGLLVGLYGAIGAVLRLAIVAVAILVAAKRFVLGLAVLADGILDARQGPVPSSSALDPRDPFAIPLPTKADGRESGADDATDPGTGTDTGTDGSNTDGADEGPSDAGESDEETSDAGESDGADRS